VVAFAKDYKGVTESIKLNESNEVVNSMKPDVDELVKLLSAKYKRADVGLVRIKEWAPTQTAFEIKIYDKELFNHLTVWVWGKEQDSARISIEVAGSNEHSFKRGVRPTVKQMYKAILKSYRGHRNPPIVK